MWVALLFILAGLFANTGFSQTPAAQPASSGLFVFVPLPCPSMAEYLKAQAFMDEVCLHAKDDHFRVIIVRSCYNEGSVSLIQSQNSNWWWDTIESLPQHYDVYIQQGNVKIVDDYPNLQLDATPWGFFFRGDKSVWNGQLNASDPDETLKSVLNSN
jgi:hypothetical protein